VAGGAVGAGGAVVVRGTRVVVGAGGSVVVVGAAVVGAAVVGTTVEVVVAARWTTVVLGPADLTEGPWSSSSRSAPATTTAITRQAARTSIVTWVPSRADWYRHTPSATRVRSDRRPGAPRRGSSSTSSSHGPYGSVILASPQRLEHLQPSAGGAVATPAPDRHSTLPVDGRHRESLLWHE
jgi:hypothetical protein